MKCEKCGYTTHPGDQVCINCGANLSLAHSYVPGIDKHIPEINSDAKKKNIKFLILSIVGVVLAIAIVVFIIIYFFRRYM